MAIYWVSTLGSDSNDGSSYANAFRYVSKAIDVYLTAGTKGDVINVVNDGIHIWPFNKTINANIGTSFSDPGLTIHGVDSGGTAAIATWIPSSESFSAINSYSMQCIAGGGWIIIEGIRFDITSFSSTTTTLNFAKINASTAGPIWCRACEFSGTGSYPGTSLAARIFYQGTASLQGPNRLSNSVVVNYADSADLINDSALNHVQTEIFNNVLWSTSSAERIRLENTAFTGATALLTGNTFVQRQTSGSSISYGFNPSITTFPATQTSTYLTAHSNVFMFRYQNLSGNWKNQSPNTLFVGSTGIAGRAPAFSQIGYNVFISTYTGSTPATSTYGIYQVGWDTDGDYTTDDLWPTDTFYPGLDITGATVSNDSGTTYTWENAGGFGYNLTVPEDLRLLTGITDGIGGILPGALPAYTSPIISGTIEVSPSISSAPWSISGSSSGTTGITFSGIGSTSFTAATGSYTITWGSATDYENPSPSYSSGTLSAAGTLSFAATYTYTGAQSASIITSYFTGWTVTDLTGAIDTSFDPTKTQDYFNYDFIIWSGTGIISRHSIIAVTATTAYTTFHLSGTPTIRSDYRYALAPTRSAKENFFNGQSYERNLIEGAPGRTNIWPSHSAVTDLLLYKGTGYDTFVSTELAWALSADTVGASPPTNILWRKLTPNGIKSLDNDEEILQKFILTMGMSFDKIKQYQDQMAFAHTISYLDYNHVPKSLVKELAKLWGWKLTHDSKNNDLSTYKLAVYDHYASGTTDAVNNLSAEDINFERWRRIVSNLVRIWKAKGTRKSLELVMDVYGIPTDLLVLKEYVYFIDQNYNSELYLREIPSGIFVRTGETGTRTWIDPADGSISTITNYPINNTKFLDVGVSESEAIFRDVYSWASTTDQTFTGANGQVIELSAFTGSRYDLENWIIQNTIPSDGSHRTASNYQVLENIYSTYISDSASAYKFGDFEAFLSFIEENFNEIVRQLIPASSRLLSQGRIYENLPYHREKFVWQPEGDVKQPFNETKTFTIPTLSGEQQTKVSSVIIAAEASGNSQTNVSSSTQTISISTGTNLQVNVTADTSAITTIASHPQQYNSIIQTAYISPSYIEQPQDAYTLVEIPSGAVFTLTTPLLTPYSADSGSVVFTAFSNSALVVTNDNKFDLYLSASNMSQSGMNRIMIELFRKLSDDEITEIRSSAFTITQAIYEGSDFNQISNNIGTYKLSSVQGLAIGDVMSASSSLLSYLNNTVKIINIYTGTNTIITTPPVGLDNLPVGKNAVRVALRSLLHSDVVLHLIQALDTQQLDPDLVNGVVNFLYTNLPAFENRSLSDATLFAKYLSNLSIETNIAQQTLSGIFDPFYEYTTSQLAGCAIVIPFLRDNPKKFSLSKDRVYIANTLINKITNITLTKVNDLFDWANPTQQIAIHQYDQNEWLGFPSTLFSGLTSINDRNIFGSVEIGGLDNLNADILRDKEEYFIRWKADAEVPQEYSGDSYFDVFSGRNMLSSNYSRQVINDIYYYGNYFVYMQTSKEALFDTIPTNSGSTQTASVEIQFKGVGDSDKLETQFLDAGPAPDADLPNSGPSQIVGTGTTSDAYTSITSTYWATATSITIAVKPNADDRTIYTLHTTLDPNRWYWWRVKNTKQKLTTFGYVLESITHSEPKLFFTGDFKDLDSDEGTNPSIPEPPTDPGTSSGGKGIISKAN